MMQLRPWSSATPIAPVQSWRWRSAKACWENSSRRHLAPLELAAILLTPRPVRPKCTPGPSPPNHCLIRNDVAARVRFVAAFKAAGNGLVIADIDRDPVRNGVSSDPLCWRFTPGHRRRTSRRIVLPQREHGLYRPRCIVAKVAESSASGAGIDKHATPSP